MVRKSDGALIEIVDGCDDVLRVKSNNDPDGDWLEFETRVLTVAGYVLVDPDDARELGERLIEWARERGA